MAENEIKDVPGENRFEFRRGKRNRYAAGMLRMISEQTLVVDDDLFACFVDG